jgi:hypothetical protein
LNKQGIYITLVNAFIGIVASLLLKDNAVVAFIIITLILGTVMFIERASLNAFLFGNHKHYALAAYAVLGIVFLSGLYLVTQPMRKTSAIVASATTYLDGIKTRDYKSAYASLSNESRQRYPVTAFVEDHANGRVEIQDFTIDQVAFNKFDNKKAVATISSPFGIYGHETINMELIREEGAWRVVFSRNIVSTRIPAPSPKPKKTGGAITNLLNSLF